MLVHVKRRLLSSTATAPLSLLRLSLIWASVAQHMQIAWNVLQINANISRK